MYVHYQTIIIDTNIEAVLIHAYSLLILQRSWKGWQNNVILYTFIVIVPYVFG